MSVAEGHGMAGNQRRWADWEARLARWRTSGTTIHQFCLDEGVCEPSSYQWLRKSIQSRKPMNTNLMRHAVGLPRRSLRTKSNA